MTSSIVVVVLHYFAAVAVVRFSGVVGRVGSVLLCVLLCAAVCAVSG